MTAQEILDQIITRAEKDDHTVFELLRNGPEYVIMRDKRKGTKFIIKTLQSNIKRLFKKYCEAIPQQDADITLLIVCSTLRTVCDFYIKDLEIINDMLDEYETYLLSGNFLDFVFFWERPEDKLYDHRS